MNTKQELRIWAKKERSRLDMVSLSEQLCRNLETNEKYQEAKNVLIYFPLKNEVNLLSLMRDKSKNFYLPKICGENLLCCPYREGDKTEISRFNTCEPITEACDKSLIDFAVIPALACDETGCRLGYGGGFYDRFLKDFEGVTAVCIPKNLIVKTIFPEKYDIKADIIITETDG